MALSVSLHGMNWPSKCLPTLKRCISFIASLAVFSIELAMQSSRPGGQLINSRMCSMSLALNEEIGRLGLDVAMMPLLSASDSALGLDGLKIWRGFHDCDMLPLFLFSWIRRSIYDDSYHMTTQPIPGWLSFIISCSGLIHTGCTYIMIYDQWCLWYTRTKITIDIQTVIY